MKMIRLISFALVVGAAIGFARPSYARQEVEPEAVQDWGRNAVRVFQEYVLKAGDTARDVVVISGSATIDGHVRGDLVVVLGSARLSSTAVVDGTMTVVAGTAALAEGAIVRHDLVVVGGSLDAPPGFRPGYQQIIIGPSGMGDQIRAVLPWFTRGLLWGRLIVPDIGWIWSAVFIFLILSLALNALLLEPVAACARTLAGRPLSTFMTGLLVLLLAGPVSVLLTATVIGVVVVPFLVCALLLAWLVGKVGVVRWIGQRVTGQQAPETALQAMRSVAVGFTALILIYMVPVLGILTWALVGVFGLGAASLAFMSGLRRERPSAPKPAKLVTPPAAPVAPDAPAMAFADTPAEPASAFPPAAPAGAASASAVLGMDLTLHPRATFLDRAAAFGIDLALMLIVASLLDHRRGDDFTPVILFGYFVGFWAWKGTTVGGIVCNLRVIRTDGGSVRFVDALIRCLSSLLSFAALGLGCLWILRDPEHQAWHDKIAGTYVVKGPEGLAIAVKAGALP